MSSLFTNHVGQFEGDYDKSCYNVKAARYLDLQTEWEPLSLFTTWRSVPPAGWQTTNPGSSSSNIVAGRIITKRPICLSDSTSYVRFIVTFHSLYGGNNFSVFDRCISLRPDKYFYMGRDVFWAHLGDDNPNYTPGVRQVELYAYTWNTLPASYNPIIELYSHKDDVMVITRIEVL